jgi:hypothetical protein
MEYNKTVALTRMLFQHQHHLNVLNLLVGVVTYPININGSRRRIRPIPIMSPTRT